MPPDAEAYSGSGDDTDRAASLTAAATAVRLVRPRRPTAAGGC
jgi:hypothetical protein